MLPDRNIVSIAVAGCSSPSSSMTSSSTSTSSSESDQRRVRVPKDKWENRQLKRGHIELNNEHLSYFNVRLIVPSIAFTVLSLGAFLAALVVSLRTDVIPSSYHLRHGVYLSYGSVRLPCNTTIPFPEEGLPSVLNMFELNVMGNVLFRLAVCIPVVLRIFHSLCLRHMVRTKQRAGIIFEVTSDILPALTGIETLSLALFSIVTMHSDFPNTNRFAKMIFGLTSSANMLATTLIMFNFKSGTSNTLDATSLGVKMLCSVAYCYLCPHYFQRHFTMTSMPLCHSYLPRIFALIEYSLIVCYGAFHLTWLVDIRDVTFVCYPRNCSGECESLDPVNFLPGGKYEHCRAFEYRQRQLIGEERRQRAIGSPISRRSCNCP